uniref:RING-type E3 ubiquitin transferase n=1 Tax=Macaca fascicularis TaxID=9541 RepID=A0A7N9D2X0_MACFA
MGPEDSAKCLRHGPQLCRWAAGDSPARERCGPRSLGSPALGLDSCRAWDHVDGQILGQLRPLAEEEEEEGAGAMSPRGPAFPGMGSEELRLASFYDWPLTAGVPPELLAAAGFFHTGQQDKVRCFFCYGGLQSWKRGDDPWTEHAKWFPSCQFLLRSKGRDFVHSVQETHSQLLGSWVSATSPRGSGRQWGPAPPISPRHRRSLAPSRTRGKNRKMQPLWPPPVRANTLLTPWAPAACAWPRPWGVPTLPDSRESDGHVTGCEAAAWVGFMGAVPCEVARGGRGLCQCQVPILLLSQLTPWAQPIAPRRTTPNSAQHTVSAATARWAGCAEGLGQGAGSLVAPPGSLWILLCCGRGGKKCRERGYSAVPPLLARTGPHRLRTCLWAGPASPWELGLKSILTVHSPCPWGP